MRIFTERVKQESFQAGEQQGGALILLRQLTFKSGGLTPEIEQRIREVDADTLLAWSGRVLTATSIAEVVR